jgi:RNA polymerase sigma factor (TIGR02999 family)
MTRSTRSTEFVNLIAASRNGDARAADELMTRVYDQLRQLAEAALYRERRGHTLQATALVHEAYLKLLECEEIDWHSETHFRAMATEAMRRLLVDHARHRKRQKRGGGWRRITLDDASSQKEALAPDGEAEDVDLSDLSEALERMRALDERQTRVVELRLLGGVDMDAIADLLGVSRRTVERDWTMGRAWLRKELKTGDPDDG